MTESNEVPEIGPAELDAVLTFLAVFSQPGYVFGEWHQPEDQFPFYSVSDEVLDFLDVLDRHHFIFPFDWPRWQAEGEAYVSDPDALERADLQTLRKLLTMHTRIDRFNEGYLAHIFESGHITAILRRLQVIREEMAS
jgi:hypothetical protein